MVSTAHKFRSRRGASLVDTLVAVIILLIALIGTTTFRYGAALGGRQAGARTSAARVALLLCESWRGLNGDETYDPIQLAGGNFQITESSWSGHLTPSDFTPLGNYEIVLDSSDPDGPRYYATLSWKDVQSGLRALNVSVAWAQRSERADDPDKSYGLTVYVRTD
jgi:Tfp pilus assembly protein PilV